MFVVTTWHHDQNEPHPEVRFFRNVTMAKEVAHRFMSDFDDGSWDIEEGEYDLWASGEAVQMTQGGWEFIDDSLNFITVSRESRISGELEEVDDTAGTLTIEAKEIIIPSSIYIDDELVTLEDLQAKLEKARTGKFSLRTMMSHQVSVISGGLMEFTQDRVDFYTIPILGGSTVIADVYTEVTIRHDQIISAAGAYSAAFDEGRISVNEIDDATAWVEIRDVQGDLITSGEVPVKSAVTSSPEMVTVTVILILSSLMLSPSM